MNMFKQAANKAKGILTPKAYVLVAIYLASYFRSYHIQFKYLS